MMEEPVAVKRAWPNITVGMDGEFFLADANGKFISSIGLIGGSKADPLPLPGMEKGFAVQEDNVAVEINIPPARDAIQFATSVKAALSKVDERLKQLGLTAKIVASAEFTEDQLANPKAREGGCDVDFNAWTGRVNPRPQLGETALRTSGGHIHVGLDAERIPIIPMIRAMDLYLGVPSMLADTDTQRRILYGKAGAFRPKPYGVEYRTLSNFWMKDEKLCHWAFNQTIRAAQSVEQNKGLFGGDIMNYMHDYADHVERAINHGDKDLAGFLCHRLHLEIP